MFNTSCATLAYSYRIPLGECLSRLDTFIHCIYSVPSLLDIDVIIIKFVSIIVKKGSAIERKRKQKIYLSFLFFFLRLLTKDIKLQKCKVCTKDA